MMRQVPDKHLMRVRKVVQRIISHPRSSTSARISSIGSILIPCVTTHTLPTWMVSIATCLLTRTSGMTWTAPADTTLATPVVRTTGWTTSTGAVTPERFAWLVSRISTLKSCRAIFFHWCTGVGCQRSIRTSRRRRGRIRRRRCYLTSARFACNEIDTYFVLRKVLQIIKITCFRKIIFYKKLLNHRIHNKKWNFFISR